MTGKSKTKASKVGRNKTYCDRYTLLGMRVRNKIKKLKRHLKSLPNDKQASRALKRCARVR